MRFTNVTPFKAGWTLGFEREGRELLIAIVKATYTLPRGSEPLTLAGEQRPLTEADEFVGEPGLSAPLRETDYAHRKPGCDVLLIGSAYAPGGAPVRSVPVSLQVGALTKRFNVIGDRQWNKDSTGVRASPPRPFTAMPLTYERAFGGVDRTREAESGKVETFLANPAGRGFWRYTDKIDGMPLPNTEEIGQPVTSADGNYKPMAFSPIGRAWEPRWRYAGTFDAHWQKNRAPFWPDDFDYRYFQAAAPDQVVPYPRGGEPVVMQNLTPDGVRRFRLPAKPMPITFVPYRGRDITRQAALDTIVFEPDAERFSLTWRVALPLGKSVFDVKETIAGELGPAWHRARRFPGKIYYRNLAEACAARGGRKAS